MRTVLCILVALSADLTACRRTRPHPQPTGPSVGVGGEGDPGDRRGPHTVDTFKSMPDCADPINANIVVEVRDEGKSYRCDPVTGTWVPQE